jgi:hypothetical protein
MSRRRQETQVNEDDTLCRPKPDLGGAAAYGSRPAPRAWTR